MKKNHCYFNGKIIPLSQARISPYDLGVLRGYGVFDVMRAQNNKPFLIADHWRRFLNSAKFLNLRVPINFADYQKIILKLLTLNGFKKSVIRTVLTGGESANAFGYEPGRETFFILIEKFVSLSEKIFQTGAKIIALDHARKIPEAKVTDYVEAIRNQIKKKKAGALEILYVKNGLVTECSTSNIGAFFGDKLVMPKDNILFGITRKLILKLAKQSGFRVVENSLALKSLLKADEVFLTATNKDIAPIVKIDGWKIGTGKVGWRTKKIMASFKDFVAKY